VADDLLAAIHPIPRASVRTIAYADPPYPGCAHRYEENTEVDHAELIARLERDFDGYVLHTSSVALPLLLPMFASPPRIMAWVKPFAAFKRNVSVAYAWEPVLVKAARKPVVSGRVVMRDWFSASITLRKGMCGAKPPALVSWLLEVVGAQANDELTDLYPGTGIVGRTWEAWKTERAKEAS
jgi:hypothetical protein